jgi:predicted amidohydrolase
MKIACAQLWPRIGELERNRKQTADAIAAAAAAGAALIVLPELCVSGYVFEDASEARRYAEPLDGPTVTGWRQESAHQGIAIVGGICELDEEGEVRNSAVVIEAGEVLAVYRKTHLWDREKLVFTPGENGPSVVETSFARLGLMICYDSFFPEAIRALALAGAELIVVPANNPVLGPELEPLPAEFVLGSGAAHVNRVFVALCDRTGHERGVDWVGATAIIDTDGRILTKRMNGEGIVFAEVDPALARDKRVGERNDVLADRRPELYGTLARSLAEKAS